MPVPKPTLDSDVEAFYKQLIEKGNLSPEETDMLHSLLSKKEVATEFKVGVNARSLTDRKLDEFKREKEKIESDYNKKLSELVSLETARAATSSTEKTRIATLEKAIRTKEDQLHKIRQKALEYEDGKEFLTAVGLDKEESIYSLPQSSPSPSPRQEGDKSLPFTKEEIFKEISANSRDIVKFTFDLHKMRDTYRNLTGKELDVDQLYQTLDKHMKEYDNDYNQIFIDKFDIATLQKQKDDEAFQARVDAAVAEKLATEKAKQLIPSDRAVGGGESDFFKSINSTVPESEKKDLGISPGVSDGGSVISDAVQHFRKLVDKKEQATI